MGRGDCHCRICKMKSEKIIALVDCNSFYCSCERLFRPDLISRPVGVLSNNDGCFVSRTNELKKLGVPMGAPYFQYKDLCEKHQVAVFSANFSLYTNISDRVMNTLFDFTPILEVYSVDEAFLDLTGMDEKTILEYCREIKITVERNTGIPVGIGIGRTKVLAKLANKMAKKDPKYHGVYSALLDHDREHLLKSIDIEDVWGIGRQNSIKFKSMNIKKAIDLKNFKNTHLIQKVFTITGRMIQDELNEIQCFPINEEAAKKKEILSSRTFGIPVFDYHMLAESVACYTSLAAEKLRKQKSVCGEISVYVRTNPYKEVPQYGCSRHLTLTSPTCDTRKLINAALTILKEIYRPGFEYKKAGIHLSKLSDQAEYQVSLFGAYDTEKDLALMYTMDKINEREGQEMLKSAACGVNKAAWYMKQVLKSPRYVTGFNELLKIKT